MTPRVIYISHANVLLKKTVSTPMRVVTEISTFPTYLIFFVTLPNILLFDERNAGINRN